MRALPPEARWFLLLHNLWWLGAALSNAFVSAFLWRAGAGMNRVALFHLAAFAAAVPAAALGAWLVRQAGAARAWRAGVAATAAAYLCTLLAGPGAGRLAPALGVLHGAGAGLYWLSFSVLSHDTTGTGNRESFFGYLSAAGAAIGTLAPLLAGTLLGRLGPTPGYGVVFGATVACFAVAAFLGARLPLRPAPGPLAYLEVLRERTGHGPWGLVLAAHLLVGAREGLLLFLPALLVFLATGGEAGLGRYQFGVGLAGAAANYALGRWLHPGPAWPWHAGAAALALQPLVLLAGFQPGALVAFGMVGATAGALFYIPWSALLLNAVDAEPDGAHNRAEYLAIRELFLGAGRIAPLVLFLAIPGLRAPRPLVWLLLGAAALMLPAARLAHRAEEKTQGARIFGPGGGS